MPKAPRPLPAPAPLARARPRQVQGVSRDILRKMAATDYITDQNGRSVRFHFERPDRGYSGVVTFQQFKAWSSEDDWVRRRAHFWEEVEVRVREERSDELYAKRLADLAEFTETAELLGGYLRPMRDKRGRVIIDKSTGLPKLPLDMPRADQFIRAYLKLHERILLLRGEVIHRAEVLNAGHEPLPQKERARGPKLSRAETRDLVRQLLSKSAGGPDAVRDGAVQVRAREVVEGAREDGD